MQGSNCKPTNFILQTLLAREMLFTKEHEQECDIYDKGLISVFEGIIAALFPFTRKYCPYGLACMQALSLYKKVLRIRHSR